MGALYAPESSHIYVNSFHLKNNPQRVSQNPSMDKEIED